MPARRSASLHARRWLSKDWCMSACAAVVYHEGQRPRDRGPLRPGPPGLSGARRAHAAPGAAGQRGPHCRRHQSGDQQPAGGDGREEDHAPEALPALRGGAAHPQVADCGGEGGRGELARRAPAHSCGRLSEENACVCFCACAPQIVEQRKVAAFKTKKLYDNAKNSEHDFGFVCTESGEAAGACKRTA